MRQLVRKDFRAWLESKPPEEPVGRARMAYCCPIAMWSQRPFGVWPENEAVWVQRFTKVIDTLGPNIPVTAAQSLEALDS